MVFVLLLSDNQGRDCKIQDTVFTMKILFELATDPHRQIQTFSPANMAGKNSYRAICRFGRCQSLCIIKYHVMLLLTQTESLA
jgi:hypothetical protein